MKYGNMDHDLYLKLQVMASCVRAQSHNLNQCSLTGDEILSSDDNFRGNT